MGHAVTVYAVAALLVAASAGPVLASVRDASLLDFESLDEPQTLNDFPFLKRVEPYLPPMVVDWLIIRPDSDLDLPENVGYRVDADGRVVLVWPHGCEETQEQFRAGSRCEPEVGPDCHSQPLHPECVQEPDCPGDDERCPPVPECAANEVVEDGECVPDPACEEPGDAGRADHCPEIEPPQPLCPPGHAHSYTGECIPTVTHQLEKVSFSGSSGDSVTLDVELKTHYRNLSLEIERAGFPFAVGWSVEVYHIEEDRRICWLPKDDPDAEADCFPEQQSGGSSGSTSLVDTQSFAPIPPGNLTFHVVYDPPSPVTTSPQLDVQLFGRPTNP